jgi:RimJ/RimL family protein N-acetyltransferase
MLILETERLTLREFVPTDVDDLARTLGDRENMRFYPKPFERADVEYWIDRSSHAMRLTRQRYGP